MGVADQGKLASLTTTLDEDTLAKFAALLASSSPRAVFEAYLEAFNSGDLNALSQFYADDLFGAAGLFGPERRFETFVGKEVALENDAEQIANNAQITISNIFEIGDTVRADFSYVDDETSVIGLDITGFADIRV